VCGCTASTCHPTRSRHLEPGGRFLVEVGVPALQRLPPGETIRAFTLTPMRLGFDEYDVASQRLVSHHHTFADGQVAAFSIPFRHVWPAEIDLMARLRLTARWGGWDRRPFTSESRSHVSVWRTPG